MTRGLIALLVAVPAAAALWFAADGGSETTPAPQAGAEISTEEAADLVRTMTAPAPAPAAVPPSPTAPSKASYPIVQSDEFSQLSSRCSTPEGICRVPLQPVGSPCWCPSGQRGTITP